MIKTLKRFRHYPQAALVALALVVFGYVVVHVHAAGVVGDLNNDGTVNVFDLSIMLSDWGTTSATADLNHDGTVSIFDLSMLLSHWGQTGSTPTPTPTPTATPTPSYCASGGSQLWTNLATCGWPAAATTGPDLTQCPNGALTNASNVTLSTANATISCENITGGVRVTAQNVTIKNSKISFNGGGAGGSGVININDGASATIDHVDTDGLNHTHACVWDEGSKGSGTYSMKVTNLNCHNINDGIFSWWSPSDRNTGDGSDFLIQDSYFHDFTQDAANGHIDGYQTEGASNGTITHNTYLATETPGDTQVSGGGLDSAIAIWDDYNGGTGKVSNNFNVSDNLITGGGFAIYAEDYDPNVNGAGNGQGGNSETNIHFTNNEFSTYYNSCVGGFGVWFYRSSWTPYFGGPTDGWNAGGSSRSGNKILETGANVDNGNPAGCG